MDAAAFPAGRWRARWIWCEAPQIRSEPGAPLTRIASGACVTACFRRTLDLDSVPASVPARATADSRYALWVNGREAMRGPVRSNGRRLHYDAFDLAPLLRRGCNAIAVLVRHFGRPNPWWAPVPPTLELGAGGFVFEARLADDHWLVSDGKWRALRADAWTTVVKASVGALPIECFDARALAADWRDADFADAAWSPAHALAGLHLGFTGHHEPPLLPYGAMLPRPIAALGCVRRAGSVARVANAPAAAPGEDPIARAMEDFAASKPLTGAARAWPLRLDAGPDTVCVVSVDFGEVVAGTVCLDVDAPAGSVIDVAAAEFASGDGVLAPDDERSGFRYVARGTNDRFETFQPLGFRWLGLAIRADGPVVLREVGVNERLYPRDPDAGPFFACSDALLNRVYAVGRRSVDLNSQDAYLDCPTREQRAWTGDAVVHQMVDFATHTDWRLACWNPELAASPRPDGMLPMAAGGDIEHQDASFIPDWALHWVRAVHNMWRWTGDRARVAHLLPVAERLLRWFEDFADDDGLASDVTGWIIIDWSSVSVAGKSSVLNALWARGLRDFAEMAEWLGDAGRARWARDRHRRLRDSFELFWDPERALYVDSAIGNARQRPVSQHALATPLAAGLVPDARVARLIETMLDESRLVHATWSRAKGDARHAGPGERGVGGPYLVLGPPPPWWDVERQIVVAQPFFAYVLHDALAEHGRADLIPAQCRRWAALLDRCATSWSETWYGGTVSHGWGSTPTRDLVVRTLGITPAEPGFTRARIAPRLGDLEWVRGAAPTPHGLIRVAIDAERIEIECPVPFDLDDGALPGAFESGRHVLRRIRGQSVTRPRPNGRR